VTSYQYDEVRDQMTYTLHKIDLVKAVRKLGLDLDDDNINDILDELPSDWDDDSDGSESYWLQEDEPPR
jgi:hypothetical protein